MIGEFGLVFCQWVLGLLFLYSSFGKTKDFQLFHDSIYQFRILPDKLIKPFSVAVLIAEIAVVLIMITGNAK